MSWELACYRNAEINPNFERSDLVCDSADCRSTYMERGNRQATLLAARARGWHCYVGTSVTGKPIEVHLCESCAGNAKRLPPNGTLENQQELF